MTPEPTTSRTPRHERAATVTAGSDVYADDAEYGPRGYLPERAARRARKIVLRAPMGLQWPIAAAVAAVLVAVVGAIYLWTATGPPGAPFVEVGPLSAVDPRGASVLDVDPAPDPDQQSVAAVAEVLVVRGGGGLAAFAAPEGQVAWCAASRRVEGDRTVWTVDGRLVGGAGSSLQPIPVRVHDGLLYVDPTGSGPALPPAPRAETPACM